DRNVTGVQTCALPISTRSSQRNPDEMYRLPSSEAFRHDAPASTAGSVSHLNRASMSCPACITCSEAEASSIRGFRSTRAPGLGLPDESLLARQLPINRLSMLRRAGADQAVRDTRGYCQLNPSQRH